MHIYDNRSKTEKIKDAITESFKLAYCLSYFAAHPNRSLEQK